MTINMGALDTDEVIEVAETALATLVGRLDEGASEEAQHHLNRACDEFDTAVAIHRGAA